jgi:hypothetical protein
LLDDGRIRIQEAQKHTDPDPEHWRGHLFFEYGNFKKVTGNISKERM